MVRAPYLTSVRLARALLAALALGVTLWAQWGASAGPVLGDEWLRDRFWQLRLDDAPDRRVLVVDIDEASLAALGPWPWPRARLADLVETLLTTYRARGVALDILLPDAGADGGDQRLALLATHAPLVLPVAFNYHALGAQPVRVGQVPPAPPAPPGPPHAAVPATGYIGVHAGLAGARVGNIGFRPDPDGVLRRLPLYTAWQGARYPALTLALLQCCHGGLPPLPDAAEMRVDFRRDWTNYEVVSARDILDQSLDAASTGGRLVLVGSSALGLADRVTTPLAAQRPGLGVHASMLSTLLDRQAGSAPAPWPGRLIASAYAALAVALALLALPRLSALRSTALLGALGAGWLLLAWPLTLHDPAMVASAPLGTLLVLLALAVPFHWQLSQLRSRHLLDTLRQYVAREVVDELLRSDLKDPLRPARREVTTLIADMEGYTAQVESLPVEEASRLTRDFLDCLTGPVLACHGTLDKYTGDGLVAFWGAPLPVEHHADLALDAARLIVARVRAMSAARVAAGYAPLRVRIGIESGPAMAGDFGTRSRSIYTAVGDSVNTAARLEQAARDFPHDVIVGAGTVERARRHRFMLLGERRLRGKEKSTTLYTFVEDQD